MANITVLNTSSDLSSKTLLSAENPYTITGLHTFSRSPSAPFAVTVGSAVVTNLNADLLDGVDGTDYARVSLANTFATNQIITGNLTLNSTGILSTAGNITSTQAAATTAGFVATNSSANGNASTAVTLSNGGDVSYVMQLGSGYSGFPAIGNRSMVFRGSLATAPSICGMAFVAEHNSIAGGTMQWFSKGIGTGSLVMSYVPTNGSTSGGVFKLVPQDNGAGSLGQQIYVGRNNNATSIAGSIGLEAASGTPQFLWVDAAGKLRINIAPPGSGISDTAGVVVGTQA